MISKYRTAGGVAALAIVALTLLGCAPAAGTAPTPGGAEIPADIKAEAAETVAQFSGVPEARQPEALPETPPKDESVVAISCPANLCTQVTDEFVKAATALGWKTDVLVADFTPEAFVQAFDTAIQRQPDFIYYLATQTNDTITTQLEAAKAAGIKVVVNSPDPSVPLGPDELVAAASGGGAYLDQVAKLQAAVVIDDATTLDHVVHMYDPSVPSYAYVHDALVKEFDKAGAELQSFEMKQSDASITLPAQVVSFLQRNPDTEYIIAAVDNHIIGIPEAIEAAGLPMPKIIGYSPEKATIEYLEAGKMFATVQADSYGNHWDGADLFARLSIGQELTPEQRSPVGNAMIGFKDTAAEIPLTTFPGVPDNYLKAWGLQ